MMVPAILAGEVMKPIIPAWKRLGLKLKSAQQESVPYVTPVVVAPAVPEPKKEKRKREIKDQEAPLRKKVKVNTKKSAKVHEPTTDTTPTQSPITSGRQRRKSVTFTPETKTEDGDSIKQLYNGWIAKYPVQDPNFHDLRSGPASKPSEPAADAGQIGSAINEVLQEVDAAKKPKNNKNKKKAKSPKSEERVKSAKQLDPALSYLKLFHQSKDTWKFNKIHQVNLLKHAFDIEKIPSQYIEIFYSYVTGLKGRARTQLRDAAITIKVKAQESAENSAEGMDNGMPEHMSEELEENVSIKAPDSASKIGYEEKVLQPLTDLAIRQRLAKRMRAERILDDFAQELQTPGEEVSGSSESIKDEEGDPESQKRLKMSDGSTQRVRRKRKQRTNAVDDSSSSDSSDSDSTSEEEDEDDEDEETHESTDEDSSSSSSSSTSTSEDDEDSGSSGSESGSNESE